MANLSAQRLPVAGVSPTYSAAAAGGDTAPIGGRFVLHVANGGASPITATVVTPGSIDGLAIGDAAVVIAAGASGFVPLVAIYKNPSTGRAAITYSAVTSVNVAVLELP